MCSHIPQLCALVVHIGEKIKEVRKTSGLSVTAFARQINCTRRNVYSIFSKPTIDTGLLQHISTVLNHDFFSHYTTQHAGNDDRVVQLEKEITYLNEINHLLRAKPEQQSQQPATAVGWRKRS